MNSEVKKRIQSIGIYFPLLMVLLALAGCLTVQLVGDYEKKIDDGVTDLQKKTETFSVKLERTCRTSEGAYSNNVQFYDDAKVDLAVLQVRTDAIALNKLTSQQIKLLRDSFDRMEAQHKLGFTPTTVSMTRQLLEEQFTGILKLEVAKKRDQKTKD